MEDSEEEEDDENYVPPEYGDAATGEAAEDQEEPDDVPNDAATGEAAEDQEEPDDMSDDDDLRGVIVDARTQCESQKEKLKFDRRLEDHKKGLYCWKYALEAIIKGLLLYLLVHDNCLLFML